MTREEAIDNLKESKRQNEVMRDNPTVFFKPLDVVSGAKNAQKRIEALDMAIDTLRAKKESSEPLTLDELRQMDGKPVWVVCDEEAVKTTPGFEPLAFWALVEVCEESIFLTNNLGGRTEYAADVELEEDGITI